MDTTYSTTYNSTASSGVSGLTLIIYLAILVFYIVCLWKIFTKAGKPGWAAIIPIYNTYILLKIVGRPVWWLLLFLIPFVNLIVAIILALDLAKSFGKSSVFGFFGLFLFSFIGYPMLAFGSSTYHGPSAGGGASTTSPTPPANPTPPAAPQPPAPIVQ